MIKMNVSIGILLLLLGVLGFSNDYSFPVDTGEYYRDGVFMSHQLHNMSQQEVRDKAAKQLPLRNNALVESVIAASMLNNNDCEFLNELESNVIYYQTCQSGASSNAEESIKYLSYELYYLEELLVDMKKLCDEKH